MIAPLRETDLESPETRRGLRAARHVVAATLLPGEVRPARARTVPAWQAWLFVGWLALAATAYVARLSGWY